MVKPSVKLEGKFGVSLGEGTGMEEIQEMVLKGDLEKAEKMKELKNLKKDIARILTLKQEYDLGIRKSRG